MNLVLTGPRASGKTTTGRILSSLLNEVFVDTDDLIEKRDGRSIGEIVRIDGWSYFRLIEKEIVCEVSKNDGLIIALGGGAVLDIDNRTALKTNGFIIWLRAKPHVLIERMTRDSITGDRRPSLTGKGTLEELREILSEREFLYRDFSDMCLDTSFLDPFKVANYILSVLREKGIKI